MHHTTNLGRYIIVLMVLLFMLMASCNSSRKTINPKEKSVLEQMAAKPDDFSGKTVELEGLYMGYSQVACTFPSTFLDLQMTRSDWVFTDGNTCIFVTGTAPKGLDPMMQKSIPVHLQALVKQKNSKLYLETKTIQIKQQ